MALNLSAVAIAGPTHENQPVFSWTGIFRLIYIQLHVLFCRRLRSPSPSTGKWANDTHHMAHATTFNFDWVVIDQNSV